MKDPLEGVTFPLLVVSGSSVSVISDSAWFLRLVALSTDKAIRDGFYRDGRLVDSAGREYRVRDLKLAGRIPLGGWMKKPRPIEALELECCRDCVSLAEVKELVIQSIRSDDDFWSENHDIPDLIEKIRSAGDLAQLFAAVR